MRVPGKFLKASLGSIFASSALLLAVSIAAPAHATLIGGPGPFPGLDPDDGTQLFVPNLNPIQLQHVVKVTEAADTIPGVISHEWGFYFASDPSTLIPIFTTADVGPPQQNAVIGFDVGFVADIDASTMESTFTPSLAPFGFYLKANTPGGTLLRYTQPVLNPGGVDAAATFPFTGNPTYYLVDVEVNDQVLSLEIVDGVIPVPESGTAILVSVGLGLIATRGRREKA